MQGSCKLTTGKCLHRQVAKDQMHSGMHDSIMSFAMHPKHPPKDSTACSSRSPQDLKTECVHTSSIHLRFPWPACLYIHFSRFYVSWCIGLTETRCTIIEWQPTTTLWLLGFSDAALWCWNFQGFLNANNSFIGVLIMHFSLANCRHATSYNFQICRCTSRHKIITCQWFMSEKTTV